MEIPADQVPSGWSNEPRHLEGFFYPGSGESRFAKCHGLDDFKLLLFTTPDTGEFGYILQSGDDYYWGDLMIDYIFKITNPKTLPGILHTLATKGDKALRMRKLKEVKTMDDVLREEGVTESEEVFEPVQKDLFTPVGGWKE